MKRLAAFFLPLRIVQIGLLLVALGFGAASLQLDMWENALPGPGLAPLLFCACLLPIALFLLIQPIEPSEKEPLQPISLIVGLLLFVYVAGIEMIGLMLPTALFAGGWAWLLYRRSPVVALAAAVVTPIILYAFFVLALRMPLTLWPG
jgi:hypothetical protein